MLPIINTQMKILRYVITGSGCILTILSENLRRIQMFGEYNIARITLTQELMDEFLTVTNVSDGDLQFNSIALQLGEYNAIWIHAVENDPVFYNRPQFPYPVDPDRTAIPPECTKNCQWRQAFHWDLQRNALRLEAPNMVEKYRCGWNLKPGHIGGDPLDYAPCIYSQ